ncbi:hypothetical protein QL285_013657 [Trifolium repens]|nr:hypothetical protein QL285_013657 [Trifolium repens]
MRIKTSPHCHQKSHVRKHLSSNKIQKKVKSLNTTNNYENNTNHDKPSTVLDGNSSQRHEMRPVMYPVQRSKSYALNTSRSTSKDETSVR